MSHGPPRPAKVDLLWLGSTKEAPPGETPDSRTKCVTEKQVLPTEDALFFSPTLAIISRRRLISGNEYMWTLVQAWARLSIPKGNWRDIENQIGCWVIQQNRFTSAPLKLRPTIWGCNLHSPGLNPCLETISAPRFNWPGMCTDLIDRNLFYTQSRMCHAKLYMCHECILPWRFMYKTIYLLSGLMSTWQLWISGRKWVKARNTTIISSQFLCHVNDHPSDSVDWATIENRIPTFWQHVSYNHLTVTDLGVVSIVTESDSICA